LIVYKKEAFDKFQTLLSRLKFDVTSYLISMEAPSSTTQPSVSTGESDYLKALEAAAKQSKTYVEKNPVISSNKVTYQNDDGFEVFEVQDEKPVGKPSVNPVYEEIFDDKSKKTARPNDPCPC
jgi:preprotein translocase subunit SecA